MPSYHSIKLIASVAIFIGSLASIYLPWIIKSHFKSSMLIMSFLNCLSGGVIFGAMLIHVMPSLFVPNQFGYPIGGLFAGISFLILLAVDRLFLSQDSRMCHEKMDYLKGRREINIEEPIGHHQKRDSIVFDKDEQVIDNFVTIIPMKQPTIESNEMRAFVFVAALSIHSFFEGLGMGSVSKDNEMVSYLIGLCSHKCLEAFALGMTIYAAHFSSVKTFALSTFYSTLTPLGILVGLTVISLNGYDDIKNTILEVFNGLSAGSFLFVSCVEMIPSEFVDIDGKSKYKFMCTLVGFFLMAIFGVLDD